eukprot:9957600-Heterocapsa_arctica.AAC.1
MGTGSSPSGAGDSGSQVECTLVHAPVSVPCSMQPAAAGRTMGAGNCGTRRKWIVRTDICSYMVPPNMDTPWLIPA